MGAHKLKDQFDSNGLIFPVDILSQQEVDLYRPKLIEFLNKENWSLNAVNRHKPHLYLKWVNDLARHPNIIKSVQEVLGPDLLLWYSVVFVKPANTTNFVPWHQDATYWALNKNIGLTLWLAFSDVTESNGCVEYLPGSHKWDDLEHSINNQEDNLLARGQELKGFDPGQAERVLLKAGQASLHHVSVLHASSPNHSDSPRLGIAFRFIPTHVYPVTLKWMKRSATLVSGVDNYNHFAKDPIPKKDYDPVGLKAHSHSVKVASIHTLFGDTARSSFRKIKDLVPTLFTKKTLQYLRLKK